MGNRACELTRNKWRKITVYAGISIYGRIDLHIIRNGALISCQYRDEILRAIVVLYTAVTEVNFMLIDDNIRPHRDNLVDDFLSEVGIVRKEWPAYSRDINPLEHNWDNLERRVASHLSPHILSKNWK